MAHSKDVCDVYREFSQGLQELVEGVHQKVSYLMGNENDARVSELPIHVRVDMVKDLMGVLGTLRSMQATTAYEAQWGLEENEGSY